MACFKKGPGGIAVLEWLTRLLKVSFNTGVVSYVRFDTQLSSCRRLKPINKVIIISVISNALLGND